MAESRFEWTAQLFIFRPTKGQLIINKCGQKGEIGVGRDGPSDDEGLSNCQCVTGLRGRLPQRQIALYGLEGDKSESIKACQNLL